MAAITEGVKADSSGDSFWIYKCALLLKPNAIINCSSPKNGANEYQRRDDAASREERKNAHIIRPNSRPHHKQTNDENEAIFPTDGEAADSELGIRE